jgi:hypothetical protein
MYATHGETPPAEKRTSHDRAGASGQTARAVARYRFTLAISIALNMLVAVVILFWPSTFADILNQPPPSPTTWPSHWGAQLIAINLLYLPGYWQPLTHRWPNYLGIAIRLSFAVFFFTQGDGFFWMGVYDGLFGILLGLTYWSVLRADGKNNP